MTVSGQEIGVQVRRRDHRISCVGSVSGPCCSACSGLRGAGGRIVDNGQQTVRPGCWASWTTTRRGTTCGCKRRLKLSHPAWGVTSLQVVGVGLRGRECVAVGGAGGLVSGPPDRGNLETETQFHPVCGERGAPVFGRQCSCGTRPCERNPRGDRQYSLDCREGLSRRLPAGTQGFLTPSESGPVHTFARSCASVCG